MPIRARIDMLTTGVRTPIGIKIFGADLNEIEKIGAHLEMIMKDIPGTRSVYAERVAGGYFVDFDLKRDQLARYGLSVADAQNVIMSAIGGENVTTTIEGRARYPVNVRYPERTARQHGTSEPGPGADSERRPDPDLPDRRHQAASTARP